MAAHNGCASLANPTARSTSAADAAPTSLRSVRWRARRPGRFRRLHRPSLRRRCDRTSRQSQAAPSATPPTRVHPRPPPRLGAGLPHGGGSSKPRRGVRQFGLVQGCGEHACSRSGPPSRYRAACAEGFVDPRSGPVPSTLLVEIATVSSEPAPVDGTTPACASRSDTDSAWWRGGVVRSGGRSVGARGRGGGGRLLRHLTGAFALTPHDRSYRTSQPKWRQALAADAD
jgi:hypothetical protein